MSIGPVPTYRALLEPALDAIARPMKRAWLNWKIAALYRERDAYTAEIDNARHAIRFLDRELATLESDRRNA